MARKFKTSDFNYDLPQSSIAQFPAEPRDHCKLMILDKKTGNLNHVKFFEILKFLQEGDLLVFNDTKVFPARLYGTDKKSLKPIEILLLSKIEDGLWTSLVKPGKRMRLGSKFVIGNQQNQIHGVVEQVNDSGSRIIRIDDDSLIYKLGELPLPPYIKKSVGTSDNYQTVYAKHEGSVAAPTAGLHFTQGLLEQIKLKKIETLFVTLHVGWDSFRPVKDENLENHQMHSEYWELSDEAAIKIKNAKNDGRRIISVGTTALRLLENVADISGGYENIKGGTGWADIFITPGYEFQIADGLITNFHLPKSTLLMLTSALSSTDIILDAYKVAVKNNYKFYSFGDAMLII